MGLHTSGHTRKNSSFSTQDEHLVLLGLEALTDGPQPPLRDTLYIQPSKQRGLLLGYAAGLLPDRDHACGSWRLWPLCRHKGVAVQGP